MKRVVELAIAVLMANFVAAQGSPTFSEFLLQLLDVGIGMTVADVGAGRGDLAFLLAEKVGNEGHVYANEVSQDKIERIKKKKREHGAPNLTAVSGTVEDPMLPEEVDYLLMVDVYHHLAKPDEFITNLQKYLKPTGRLAVAAVLNKRNPQAKPRTSKGSDPCVSDPQETRKAIERTGFIFEKTVLHEDPKRNYFWPTSYVLIFRLPDTPP
jgi:ubiquinone/menaquinone biosynthesis C-methylase UbiE